MELLTAKRTDGRKLVNLIKNCWYIVPSVDAHHIPASGKVPRSGIKEHVLSQIGLSQSFSLPFFWLLIPFHAFAPIEHDCQLTRSLIKSYLTGTIPLSTARWSNELPSLSVLWIRFCRFSCFSWTIMERQKALFECDQFAMCGKLYFSLIQLNWPHTRTTE